MLREDLAAHLNEPVLSSARKDFPLLRPEMSIDAALARIRETGVGEKIIYFYVADDEDRLLGVVPTRRLLISPLDRLVRDLMVPNVIAIPRTATLLEACELFVLHKFLAFPVVDAQRHVCGVIDISFFATEVFEMSEEQPHDAIFEAIGLHVEQFRNASAAAAFRFRFPWLLGTIASGTLCALLAAAFEATLAHAITIAFFLPLVLGLNESVAMQSMSLSLQSLHSARGNFRQLWHGTRREVATSFLLGLACAVIVGVIVALWRKSVASAVVISTTILASLLLAGLLGFAVPRILRLGKRDPKIAAGPITLALTDVFALLFYFTLAMLALT